MKCRIPKDNLPFRSFLQLLSWLKWCHGPLIWPIYSAQLSISACWHLPVSLSKGTDVDRLSFNTVDVKNSSGKTRLDNSPKLDAYHPTARHSGALWKRPQSRRHIPTGNTAYFHHRHVGRSGVLEFQQSGNPGSSCSRKRKNKKNKTGHDTGL